MIFTFHLTEAGTGCIIISSFFYGFRLNFTPFNQPEHQDIMKAFYGKKSY